MTSGNPLRQNFYNQKKTSPVGNQFSNIKSPPSISAGSPYLPNYLLGNSSPATASSGYGVLLSKNAVMTQTSNRNLSRSPPSQMSSHTCSTSPDNRLTRFSPPHISSSSSKKEKPGAPPTEGLYQATNQMDDSIMEMEMSSNKRLATRFSVSSPGDRVFSPNKATSLGKENDHMFGLSRKTIQSPAQIDPFYSQGDSLVGSDTLDDTAVTVFGFPPAASSFILQQFSQYGAMECHEIHNTGNWLHIKYQTRIQAKKALSKNGKIFARSIMIGVCSCIKKDLAFLEEQENGVTGTPSGTPGRPKIGTKRPNPASIRSLSSSSSMTNSPAAAINIAANTGTPQKKNSVVTKALDYVFGW